MTTPTRYISPHFSGNPSSADLCNLPGINLIPEVTTSPKDQALTFLCNPSSGPTCFNIEGYPDNLAAARTISDTLRDYLNTPAKGPVFTRAILNTTLYGPYLPQVHPSPWALFTPASRNSTLICARDLTANILKPLSFTCFFIDAYAYSTKSPSGAHDRTIHFPSMTDLETWRLYVLSRTALLEPLNIPLFAFISNRALHNGTGFETPLSPSTITLMTQFLLSLNVTPILLCGWSDLQYQRTRNGHLPITADDRLALTFFAQA